MQHQTWKHTERKTFSWGQQGKVKRYTHTLEFMFTCIQTAHKVNTHLKTFQSIILGISRNAQWHTKKPVLKLFSFLRISQTYFFPPQEESYYDSSKHQRCGPKRQRSRFLCRMIKETPRKKSTNFFYGGYGDIRCSPEQSVKSPMMLSSRNSCPEGASFSSHASTETATQGGNSDCQRAAVPGVQSIHEPIPDGQGHIKSQSTQPSMSTSQKLKSLPGCADLESSPKKAKDSLTNIFPIPPSMWDAYR